MRISVIGQWSKKSWLVEQKIAFAPTTTGSQGLPSLSSVGLGHRSVIFLCHTITASPPVSAAVSSHDDARLVSIFSRRDLPSLQETWCWPVPPTSRTYLPAASCRHLDTAFTVSSVTQPPARPSDAGGARYSPLESPESSTSRTAT